MRYLHTLICLLATLFITHTTSNAQHYWVGGSGNWSDVSHWATSSGGGTNHANPPTMNDDVIFDANSFTASGQTVTMDEAQGECNSMTWTGVTNNPGFESFTPNIINIYGSLTLSPDMTCNLRFVEMESDNPGNTIATGGTSLGTNAIFRLHGEGGWALQDVLNCRDVQMQSGTFNSNGNTINCEFSFTTSSTLAKTLNLNNSTLNIRQWRTRGSNITFNMESCTIYAQSFYADEENTGPYTYGNLVINDGGSINGTGTFNNIIFSYGDWPPTVTIESGQTVTCQQFQMEGSRYFPIEIFSSEQGKEATLSQATGTVDAEYLILQDIHAAGGATFNANNSEDLGNNNGWNITAPQIKDYYWVGNAGNFSDLTHWAKSSGGSNYHDELPSRYDNLIFDANSVTEAGVQIDIDTAVSVRNVTCDGVTNMPILDAPYAHPLTVYGDLDFTDSMDHSIYNLRCQGRSAGKTVYLNPEGYIQNLSFWGESDWTLMSEVNCANFSVNLGQMNTNDQMINCGISFKQSGRDKSILDLTGSEIHTLRFQLQDDLVVFDAGESHIYCRSTFDGKSRSYNEVTFSENAVVSDGNTFNTLTIMPGTTIEFEADSVQRIIDQLNLPGIPSGPINMSSSNDGTQATLSWAGGTVDGTYLILKDMNATGGATFNATQSIDNGNNTGWNITEIVPLDFYWVGNGGDWSDHDNHWAKSSGGSEFYGFVPGPLDNVFFDANSFDADDQFVTIDLDQVNMHNMTWTGVTNTPWLSGGSKVLNIYGSLTYDPNMLVDVREYNFLSEEDETLHFGDPVNPGDNAILNFVGSGSWSLQDSMSCRELILHGGTFNSNNHGIHVDFKTGFMGDEPKTLNLGSSNMYSRSLGWIGIGSHLEVNASDSYITCTSDFSPVSLFNDTSVVLNFNDLHFLNNGLDRASIFGALSLNNLTLDPGVEMKFWAGATLEVNQLVAQGTDQDFIKIYSSSEGTQAIISQADGVVDGQYLELQDLSATGGAEFNANNSINLGNVSGWTFFGQAQTIDFDPIDDVLETANPFDIMATASSGLDVTLEVIAGPAELNGNTITITGAGEVQIKASQEGNINYNPAPSVIQSFCSVPLTPTISLDDSDSTLLISDRPDGNQWFRDGAMIPGATSSTYKATLSGSYSVQAIYGICTSDMSNSIQITTTSTIDVVTPDELDIYPNPVVDYLFLSPGVDFADPVDFNVFDISGSQVMSGRYDLRSGTSTSMSVASLDPGIYLLIAHTEQGLVRHRFVKM